MKIILHTYMAGPKGSRDPGPHDVPDDEAKALIEAGHATQVADVAPETATRPPAEQATLPRPRNAGK